METVGRRYSAVSVAAASTYWRAGEGGRGREVVRREREGRNGRKKERERRKK